MRGLEGEPTRWTASINDGGEEEETEEGDDGSLGLGKFLFSSFALCHFFKQNNNTKSNGLDSTSSPRKEEETEEGDDGSLGLGKFLFSSFARSAGLNVPFF